MKSIKLKMIIRYFLGLVFIVSALLKMLSIDSFEVYIYSFGLLKYNVALVLTRLIIAVEILLGTLLILGIYIKKTVIISLILLSLFCVFISYLLFTNNEEHCHCFGDVVQLSHTVTLVKNLVFIALLLFIYTSIETSEKHKKWFFLVSFVLSFSLPFLFAFPHSAFNNRYTNNNDYNEVLLKEYINQEQQFAQGKHILCFFGTDCKFCKLASNKLSNIVADLNEHDIVKVVSWGTESAIANFYIEANSISFKHTFLAPEKLLKITEGAVPLIILLEDGVIKGKYNYGNLNETAISNFITE